MPRRAGRLVARARPDEEAEREGAHVLHLVDQNDGSVVENVGGGAPAQRHSRSAASGRGALRSVFGIDRPT